MDEAEVSQRTTKQKVGLNSARLSLNMWRASSKSLRNDKTLFVSHSDMQCCCKKETKKEEKNWPRRRSLGRKDDLYIYGFLFNFEVVSKWRTAKERQTTESSLKVLSYSTQGVIIVRCVLLSDLNKISESLSSLKNGCSFPLANLRSYVRLRIQRTLSLRLVAADCVHVLHSVGMKASDEKDTMQNANTKKNVVVNCPPSDCSIAEWICTVGFGQTKLNR